MVTFCVTLSVSFRRLPSNHATYEPACDGSADVAFVIGLKPSVEACVQPVPFDSKPGFVSSCAAEHVLALGVNVAVYVVSAVGVTACCCAPPSDPEAKVCDVPEESVWFAAFRCSW